MVRDQAVGTSNGAANQLFPLRPVLSSLGVPAGALTRVLVDFTHTAGTFDPNPQVTVGGEAWEIKQFLLTDESRVTGGNNAKHFMIDAEEQRIRFGDGVFGALPPSGHEIRCSYRLLQGPAALVAANSVVNRLDPVDGLEANEEIRVVNGDAEGGGYFFSPEERMHAGIEAFRRPRRLITAADFETVLLNDFNDYQRRAKRSVRVHRAVALMNSKPQAMDQSSPDSVTIMVLAAAEQIDLDLALNNVDLSIEQRQKLIALGAEPADSIERFLDRRRLITTRTFVLAPVLAPVFVSARVTVAPDRSVPDMVKTIKDNIGAFFGVTRGGAGRNGWPFGGDVYRSKLFRLIEDLDGVDFVNNLTLSPADSNGDVPLGPLSLPALAGLSVIVTRRD
jgi:predicted phage baseplate assembly protein